MLKKLLHSTLKYLRIYDTRKNRTYCEYSDGLWTKCTFDSNNDIIYHETSGGFWVKYGYDSNSVGNYYEDSNGLIEDRR